MSLLTVLTYVLARHRKVSAISEAGKHLAVALVIIFVSKGIGHWITTNVWGSGSRCQSFEVPEIRNGNVIPR